MDRDEAGPGALKCFGPKSARESRALTGAPSQTTVVAMTTSQALSALVNPLRASEFLARFWPDEAFVAHGPLARLPSPLRDPVLAEFDALAQRYAGRILFGRGRKGPRAIPAQHVAVADLYAMGLSLYLPDVEPIVPGATGLLRELERALGLGPGEARITAWASPEADGIACHLDSEEVFSIQLVGTKRFHVAEPAALVSPVGVQYADGGRPDDVLYPQAADGFPVPEPGAFSTIEMQPGSVLFLPRGHWHWTEADTDSLSISIVLSPRSPVDHLLARLRPLLLQDPRWRRPAYGASDQPRLATLLDDLPEITRRLTIADLDGSTQPGGRRFQAVPGMEAHGGSEEPAVDGWISERRSAFSAAEIAAALPRISPERLEVSLDRLIATGALTALNFDDLAELRARPG